MLSRETAGLSDGWQVMGTPAAGPAQDLPADNLKSSEADIAASSAPLGGMGDEAAPIAPIPPLGGLGDEEEPVPAACARVRHHHGGRREPASRCRERTSPPRGIGRFRQ